MPDTTLLAVVSLTVVNAADIYVSPHGDNSDGGSWLTAWTDIQAALNLAGDGDTIYLAGDTFEIGAQLDWTVSGVSIRGGYAGNGTAVA